MSKTERNKKQQNSGKRTPGQPKELIELAEQELERVQGGRGAPSRATSEKRKELSTRCDLCFHDMRGQN